MTGHVSSLALDALALGALPEPEAAAVRAHLDACAACRAGRDAADELRAHFTRAVLPRTQPARHRPRARWWLAVPALAAAAAIALVVVHGRTSGPRASTGGDLAIKGDAAWQVVARRGDRTFAVHDGTKLAAGDRVRFVVVPNGARYLIVGSVDGGGAVSIYFPWDGDQSGALSGPRVELPDSVVLDAAPGPERLFAIFSDQPIAIADVRARLAALGARGVAAIRAAHRLDLAARVQLTLMFEKETP